MRNIGFINNSLLKIKRYLPTNGWSTRQRFLDRFYFTDVCFVELLYISARLRLADMFADSVPIKDRLWLGLILCSYIVFYGLVNFLLL